MIIAIAAGQPPEPPFAACDRYVLSMYELAQMYAPTGLPDVSANFYRPTRLPNG